MCGETICNRGYFSRSLCHCHFVLPLLLGLSSRARVAVKGLRKVVYNWEISPWPDSVTGWIVYNKSAALGYGPTYYWWDGRSGLPAFSWGNVLYGTLQNTQAKVWYVDSDGNVDWPNPFFVSQWDSEIISAYLCAPPTRNHSVPFVEIMACYQMWNDNQATWPQTLGIPPISQGWNSRTSFVSYRIDLYSDLIYYYNYGFWYAIVSPGWKMGNAWDNGIVCAHAAGISDYWINNLRFYGDRNWSGIY